MTADQLVDAATAKLNARDLVSAGELAESCLTSFPEHLPGYFVACEVARARRDILRADAIILAAKGKHPNQPWIYVYFAYNAFIWGHFQTAAARYYDAAVRFPDFVPALKGLAESFRELGLAELSAAVLDAGLRNVSDPSVLVARVQIAARQGNWQVVATTAQKLMEEFPEALGQIVEHLERVPASEGASVRRDIGRALASLPVATEVEFTHRLDLLLAIGDIASALELWRAQADRRKHDDGFYIRADRLLRAALMSAEPADLGHLIHDLLAQPMVPSTIWYPRIIDLAQTLNHAGHHEALDLLRRLILPVIDGMAEPGPTALLARVCLDRTMPYDQFELWADRALAHLTAHNIWIKLFDLEFRPLEDARRYIRRYLDAGYPFAPTSQLPALAGMEVARCILLVAMAQYPEGADELLRRLRQAPLAEGLVRWVWEAVAPGIAVRFRLEGDPPAIVRRLGERLRIGVAVSGQLRGFHQAKESWRLLGWDEHDTAIAVHTWRNIGRRFPENAMHVARAFQGRFKDALVAASGAIGYAELMRRYPALFAVFRGRLEVTDEDLRETYQTDRIVVEDDNDPRFRDMQNQDKMLYKAESCHQLLLAGGRQFDLVVRMRPDKEVSSPTSIDWARLFHESAVRNEIYADAGFFMNVGYGFCIGDQFAVGTSESMHYYAHAATLMRDPNVQSSGWLAPRPLAHTSFAFAAFVAGVRVKPLSSVTFGGLLGEDPLSSTQVRPLILQDMNGAPRDDIDRQLLEACDG